MAGSFDETRLGTVGGLGQIALPFEITDQGQILRPQPHSSDRVRKVCRL